MATYRARRVPDNGRFDEPEVLVEAFEANDEAAAFGIGNAAVRRTHVLYRGSDYRLERLTADGGWKQVGYLDTASPGLDGVPHVWAEPRGEGDGRDHRAELDGAIRTLDALPAGVVRELILDRGLIDPALDALVELARSADDPEIRAEARALLGDRGLSLLLAVDEDRDISVPDDDSDG